MLSQRLLGNVDFRFVIFFFHFRAVIDEINTNKVPWIQCRPTSMNLIYLGMKPSMI